MDEQGYRQTLRIKTKDQLAREALANELELPIHMHVHETQAEVRGGVEAHGCRPIERLRRLGILSSLADKNLVNDRRKALEIALYADDDKLAAT